MVTHLIKTLFQHNLPFVNSLFSVWFVPTLSIYSSMKKKTEQFLIGGIYQAFIMCAPYKLRCRKNTANTKKRGNRKKNYWKKAHNHKHMDQKSNPTRSNWGMRSWTPRLYQNVAVPWQKKFDKQNLKPMSQCGWIGVTQKRPLIIFHY